MTANGLVTANASLSPEPDWHQQHQQQQAALQVQMQMQLQLQAQQLQQMQLQHMHQAQNNAAAANMGSGAEQLQQQASAMYTALLAQHPASRNLVPNSQHQHHQQQEAYLQTQAQLQFQAQLAYLQALQHSQQQVFSNGVTSSFEPTNTNIQSQQQHSPPIQLRQVGNSRGSYPPHNALPLPHTRPLRSFASQPLPSNSSSANSSPGHSSRMMPASYGGHPTPLAIHPFIGGPGSILLVENLDPIGVEFARRKEQTRPDGTGPYPLVQLQSDHLFTIFGVYGDVVRVKLVAGEIPGAKEGQPSPISPLSSTANSMAATPSLNSRTTAGSHSPSSASTTTTGSGGSLILPPINLGEGLGESFSPSLSQATSPTNASQVQMMASGATSSALIQFMSKEQAALAAMHLEGVRILGPHSNPIRVSVSHFASIPNTRASNGAVDVKDYAHHAGHRFKYVSCKNTRHICGPCAALHLSGLGDGITEGDLREYFQQVLDRTLGTALAKDAFVSLSLFGTPDRRMAFLVLSSLEASILALVFGHNVKLKGKYMRITFSHAKEHQSLGINGTNVGAIHSSFMNGANSLSSSPKHGGAHDLGSPLLTAAMYSPQQVPQQATAAGHFFPGTYLSPMPTLMSLPHVALLPNGQPAAATGVSMSLGAPTPDMQFLMQQMAAIGFASPPPAAAPIVPPPPVKLESTFEVTHNSSAEGSSQTTTVDS